MPNHAGRQRRPTCACCFIVPPDVLKRYAQDASLDDDVRGSLSDTYAEVTRLKKMRETSRVMSLSQRGSVDSLAPALPAEAPRIQDYDCGHRQSLPGSFVADPTASADEAVSTVHATTAKVAEFYLTVFNRNSVDRQGLDLVSSLHYRQQFQNAFWEGRQMVYGDGDGIIFTGFHKSPDVIGHELTHGVTQFESGLLYEGESGALNESISDVFGATFNQWLNGWDTGKPEGWLIGAKILGSHTLAAGKTCLRDLNDPGAEHCLSPQPVSYAKFDATADVHVNSGIPNKAFRVFAENVGGKAWERAAQVWYTACTDGLLPSSATIAQFADRTLAAARAVGVEDEAAEAWAAVDVPLSALTRAIALGPVAVGAG